LARDKGKGSLSKKTNSLVESTEPLSFSESFEFDGMSIDVTASYQPANWIDTSEWPDERVAICPSCSGGLKKVPGAKTKCPNCSEFVYVRTDPRTKSRRVVKESELEDIEDAWAIQSGSYEVRQESKRDREFERGNLAAMLNRQPKESELDLHLIQRELLDHLKYRQMGLARNDYLLRGQIEFKEGNFLAAALSFLTVVLLDGNGATNAMEHYEEDEYGNETRSFEGTGFDKRDAMYLPYLAKELSRCVNKGSLNGADVLRDFTSFSLETSLGCKISMEVVWSKFVAETGCTFAKSLGAN
jgi:predicted RNA-binding Zn-ribbon protein involved in translation (DUF1610 family)